LIVDTSTPYISIYFSIYFVPSNDPRMHCDPFWEKANYLTLQNTVSTRSIVSHTFIFFSSPVIVSKISNVKLFKIRSTQLNSIKCAPLSGRPGDVYPHKNICILARNFLCKGTLHVGFHVQLRIALWY
jgi:hypothetical protein